MINETKCRNPKSLPATGGLENVDGGLVTLAQIHVARANRVLAGVLEVVQAAADLHNPAIVESANRIVPLSVNQHRAFLFPKDC